MLTIIPAIDIIDGKCVRLSKGDYGQKKIYNENPLEVAKKFESHGIVRLHLVDLDGAKEKHVVNWKILEKIAGHTSLEIDFGGGIKSDEDLRIVFDNGASLATVGSVAAKEPELFNRWIEQLGADKFILGADVDDGKIAVSGWQEITDIELDNFLKGYLDRDIRQVLCTDISKDGMLQGTSFELYQHLMETFPDMYLIASGGITHIDELYRLDEAKVPAAIIGKAIYEGRITIEEIGKLILNGLFK
jgi:phosphoribosylformimino-5-aminoimidazole carboxamide ribotide isomerase